MKTRKSLRILFLLTLAFALLLVPAAAVDVADAAGLADAIAAGGEIKLTGDIEVDADATILVAAGKTVTLDLNGKTITSESDQTGSNRNLFDVRGTLTVQNGNINYQHTGTNMGWNSSTNVFNVTAGGVLNIENAVIENKGGSDMGFVAHLNNWGEVTLNVTDSVLKSNYVAVRAFNSGYDANNVTISNTELEGGSYAFWVHNFTAADIASYDAATVEGRLNFDIFGNGNTFTGKNSTPIRLGMTNSIYLTADGKMASVASEWALNWAVAKGLDVILTSDIALTAPLTVAADKTITLDLNGKKVTYANTIQNEAMIDNKGTLIINDSSDAKTGEIYYDITAVPADPSYGKGNYTISNGGTLTVNGGKIHIANLSSHAKYPINNNSTGGNAVLVINGGHLYNYNTSAIRLFCNSTTNKNSVTIKGGVIEGYSAIWMQNPGSKTVNGTLTITGGEIKTTAKAYVAGTATVKEVSSNLYATSQGGAWDASSAISLTGGTFNENVNFSANAPLTYIGEGATFNGNVSAQYAAAKVGDQLYATITEAINAAGDGETITLLSDITTSEIITIDKAITLDGNYKTLTSTAGRAINVSGANGVTIQDLFIKASGERAINVIQNATNVTIDNVAATAANYTVNVAGSAANAVITVKNSDLTGLNVVNIAAAGANVTVDNCIISCVDQNKLESYGAVSINKDGTNACVTIKNSTINPDDDSVKASVTGKGAIVTINGSDELVQYQVAYIDYGNYQYTFATLEGAINYAKTGETVVMVRDAVLTKSTTLTEGASITPDGCTIFLQDASVTLTAPAGLEVECNADDYIVVYENGTYKAVPAAAKVGDQLFATITEAINAGDGETVYVYPGTFSEYVHPWGGDSTHAIEKSITLLGAAAWCPEKGETVLTGGMYLGYDDAKTRDHTITVKGFTFQNKGLTIADQKTVTVEKNTFTNIDKVAILVMDQFRGGAAGSATIQNNTINGAETGIELRRPHDVTVTGNIISNIGHNPIQVSGSANADKGEAFGTITITDNTMTTWGTKQDSTGNLAGRALRVTGGESVTFTGNSMTCAAAPEEFVKITGMDTNTVVDLTQNYWSGNAPTDAGIVLVETSEQVSMIPYYTDADLTEYNTYTMTYDPANGEDPYEAVYAYGEDFTLSAAPTKTGYDFVGWLSGDTKYAANAPSTAYASVTYTAQWAKASYTATFVNEDGTELWKGTFLFEETPAYQGVTPTKTADAQYTYTFKGWDKELAPITGEITYTATFEGTLNKYTVTFKNEDGTVLQTGEVAYGETPVYAGETPTKTATADKTFAFTGWTPAVEAVTGEATYTAVFADTAAKYTVTFVDEDGTTVLKEAASYAYGTAAADIVKPADPTKAADAQYTYTFAGWTPEIAAVTGNMIYKATYTQTLNKYTVTFKNEDGTVLQTGEVAYGETPAYAGETPTKATTADKTFTFSGWTPAIVPVTAEATYTATFTDASRAVSVESEDDSTVIFYDSLAEAVAAVKDGETINLHADIDEETITISKETFFFVRHGTYDFDPFSQIVAGEGYSRHLSGSPLEDYLCVYDFSAIKPVITEQPVGVSMYVGKSATFTVTAEGDELTYQWERFVDGEWIPAFEDNASAKTATFETVVVEDPMTIDLRCAVTNQYGFTTYSDAVTLIVAAKGELIITGQPESVTIPTGNTATFTVTAEGDELTYQWERFVDGEWIPAFEDNASAKTATFKTVVVEQPMTINVRCAVTDKYETTVYSDPAVLTVVPAIAITAQPEDYTAYDGQTAEFHVEAEGTWLTYQWERFVGGEWTPAYSDTATEPDFYTDTVYLPLDGMKIRCAISDRHGFTVYTDEVTLNVKGYTVTWKNADGTVLETDIDVTFNADPTYDGAEPTKTGAEGYTYTFAGWTPAVTPVTGNATYTATYTAAVVLGDTTVSVEAPVSVNTAAQVEDKEAILAEVKEEHKVVVETVIDEITHEDAKVETQGLESATADKVETFVTVEVVETAAETLKEELQLEAIEDMEIEIKVETTLDIEIKDVKVDDEGGKTLALNITPVAQVVATGTKEGGETVTIPVGEKQEITDLTDTEKTEYAPITIKIPVPAAFAEPGEFIYIIHEKSNGEKFSHKLEVQAGGYVEFENTNGFSNFRMETRPTYIVKYEYAGDVPTNAPAKPADAAHSVGASVYLVTPDTVDNYDFAWDTTGLDLHENSDGIYFIMPDTDVVIVGEWVDIAPVVIRYKVTTEAENGTINIGERYKRGDVVTFTVTPDAGYVLKSLTVTRKSGAEVSVTEKDGTFTFKMPAAQITVKAEFVLAFEDIESDHKFYEAIEWVFRNGLMNGKTETTFDRVNPVTRQQVWRVLARIINREDPGSMAAAKEWAVAQGITDGTNPGTAATREEFVTMLWIAYGKPAADTSALTAFSDASAISADSAAAMAWAVEQGIVGGYEDGTLRPAASASRGAFAAILFRYLAK